MRRFTSKALDGSTASELMTADERGSIRILIIDREPGSPKEYESLLRAEGYQCEVARQVEEALQRLTRDAFDIMLIDQDLPDLQDVDILAAIERRQPESVAVMMSARPTSEAAVRAIRAGAWDYLPKPFTPTQLSVLVARAAYTQLRTRELSLRPSRTGHLAAPPIRRVLGVSAPIHEALRRARKVARTDTSVFITGESGTGKELIAQLIHRESHRGHRQFVAVNCAALPEQLLESEMFGHRRGAFTGAVQDKVGLVEVAHEGTFFLDEVSDMPLSLQAKLLRVLQDGVIRRVGSENDDSVVDVRWISATNRDPREVIDQSLLRHDLFYRLRVIPIHLPPLRERREDIPVLVKHFVEHFWNRHQGRTRLQPRLTHEAMEALVWHRWPGNVRELQNVIEHLVALSEPGEVVGPSRLPFLSESDEANLSTEGADRVAETTDFELPFRQAKTALVDRFERKYLSLAVTRSGGNLSQAARVSGIDRTTLYRLMEKHGLSKTELTDGARDGDGVGDAT